MRNCLILLCFLLIPLFVYGQPYEYGSTPPTGTATGSLTVSESDNTPSVSDVSIIKVDQDDGLSITNDGAGQVTLNLLNIPDYAVSNEITLTGITQITNRDIDNLSGQSSIDTNWVINSFFDFGSGSLEFPNSTTLPGTCNVGEIYFDTDATSGQRVYGCESADTWVLQGDGGGGGSGYATIQDETTPLTQRTTVNFAGAGVNCVDNAGQARTDCTISGASVGSDSIGTDELDDDADTPGSGEYLRVDTVDQAGIEYRSTSEVLSDIGAITASSTNNLTNKTFDANGTGNNLSNVDLADVTFDPILETELDTEAEVESQITDVTNFFTNNDTIPDGNVASTIHRDSETKDGDNVDFDDVDANFTATNVDDAISELDDVNGSGPNATDGKVDWSQLVSVPAGFADGTDDGAGGSGYATVEEEGTPLTQRTVLNFIGSSITCADNAGGSQTDCTLTDDDVPESGDFGAAAALEADGSLTDDYILETELDALSEFTTQLSITGTADGTTFLRGDGTWATPAGGVSIPVTDDIEITGTDTLLSLFDTSTQDGLFAKCSATDCPEVYLGFNNNIGSDANLDAGFVISPTRILVQTGETDRGRWNADGIILLQDDSLLFSNSTISSATSEARMKWDTSIDQFIFDDGTNEVDIRIKSIRFDDGTNEVGLALSGDRLFHDLDADETKDPGEEFIDLQIDTKCLYLESPLATDDLQSIWITSGFDVTITKMWCESDQTVNLDLQIDDGTPADVNGTDLICDSTPALDETLSGDTTMADGDRLDLVIDSVSGGPTWVSLCWTYEH